MLKNISSFLYEMGVHTGLQVYSLHSLPIGIEGDSIDNILVAAGPYDANAYRKTQRYLWSSRRSKEIYMNVDILEHFKGLKPAGDGILAGIGVYEIKVPVSGMIYHAIAQNPARALEACLNPMSRWTKYPDYHVSMLAPDTRCTNGAAKLLFDSAKDIN